jgi:hypothetical protein
MQNAECKQELRVPRTQQQGEKPALSTLLAQTATGLHLEC